MDWKHLVSVLDHNRIRLLELIERSGLPILLEQLKLKAREEGLEVRDDDVDELVHVGLVGKKELDNPCAPGQKLVFVFKCADLVLHKLPEPEIAVPKPAAPPAEELGEKAEIEAVKELVEKLEKRRREEVPRRPAIIAKLSEMPQRAASAIGKAYRELLLPAAKELRLRRKPAEIPEPGKLEKQLNRLRRIGE
jgi:hypothetical protein